MALLVSVYNLKQSFAGRELFRDISFGINEGEKVALLGPNGVGKSTLLRILAKQIIPDSGDLTFQKNIKLAFLEQTPQFKPEDTIASYLLNHHNLAPETMAKAYEWISKLELDGLDENINISDLSGGWQKRVFLAKQLTADPDLLLLDEPTNHLDMISIKWLEDFLINTRIACFIVTHDRLFLQRVCQKIYDLDPRFPGHLLKVDGSYSQYLEIKENLISGQREKQVKLQNTLRREKEWLHRGAIARQAKQTARINSAAELAGEVQNLKHLNRNRDIELQFETSEKKPQKLVEAINISKKYNDKMLYQNLNLIIAANSRVALLGKNGSGKSTLIKTLIGQLPPDQGQIKIADNIKVSYFEQGRDTLKLNLSVLKNICPEGDNVDFRGNFVNARAYLERFQFFKEKVDLPVNRLSGGEQSRLRLAQIMLQDCNILILDEPTNDLDIETLNSLQDSLQDFKGAVLLVTHDRYFMDQVAKQIIAFSPFPEDQGQLIQFADYLQWEAWFIERQNQIKEIERAKAKAKSKPVVERSVEINTEYLAPAKKNSKTNPRLSYIEKYEYDNIEPKIHDAEIKLKAMKEEILKPELADDAGKLHNLYSEISKLELYLENLYNRWTELEAKIKS